MPEMVEGSLFTLGGLDAPWELVPEAVESKPADETLDLDVPDGLKLRPYQREGIESFFRDLKKGHDRQLIVLPTGCGKTFVFGTIARYIVNHGIKGDGIPGRVLILAHRGELLEQAQEELEGLGVQTVREQAGQRALNATLLGARVVVGSVQTMRGDRLAEWPKDYFDIVIVDEAHHAPAQSYQTILNHFTAAALYVTATPERGDEETLGVHLTYRYPLGKAMEEDYLCRLDVKRSSVKVDLRGIKTTGGDFNIGELEDRINAEMEPLCRGTKLRIGDRPTIVFTPDVSSARAFADMMHEVDILDECERLVSIGKYADTESAKPEAEMVIPRRTRAVWGSSPKHGVCTERDDILKDFKAGKFQVLCNCALLTEGYNHPPVSAIVLARPTKRAGLLMQMIGRGTRKSEKTGKKDCLVVDFGWVVKKGGLESPIGLFLQDEKDKKTREIAAELVESGKVTDPLEAVLQARKIRTEQIRKSAEHKAKQEELKRKREQREAKRIEREAKRLQKALEQKEEEEKRGLRVKASGRKGIKISGTGFDPVGVAARSKRVDEPEREFVGRKALSFEQIGKLRDLGIKPDTVFDPVVADATIAYWTERQQAGMASYKQIKHLSVLKTTDPVTGEVQRLYSQEAVLDMTSREASRILAPLFEKWRA